MAGRLNGKVAIVTGAASRGFGRTTAVLFAREGADVVIGDLDETSAKETVEQIKDSGGRAEYIVGDVSTRETAGGLVDQALSSFGKLDILVNNAGIA